MFEAMLRANGFRRKGARWTRQNLTAGGLFDLEITPREDGQYDCVLSNNTGPLVHKTYDADATLSLVTTFLTS